MKNIFWNFFEFSVYTLGGPEMVKKLDFCIFAIFWTLLDILTNIIMKNLFWPKMTHNILLLSLLLPNLKKPGIFNTSYTKNGIFMTPIQQDGILKTPIRVPKNAFSRAPYKTKGHFWDPPIQHIFAFLLTIQKWPTFDPPTKKAKIGPRNKKSLNRGKDCQNLTSPYTKNGQNLTPYTKNVIFETPIY